MSALTMNDPEWVTGANQHQQQRYTDNEAKDQSKIAGEEVLQAPSASVRLSTDTTQSDLSLRSNELPTAPRQALINNGQNTRSRTFKMPDFLAKFWLRNKGVVYVMLAQFFGSTMNTFTRILENPGGHGEGMHPFQLLFTRMSITVILSLAYMIYSGINPLGDKSVRPLLVLRGMGGFFGVCGLYFSLVYLPISEAVVLTFLGPMLSCYVYSFIRPSEPFTRTQQIAAYVSMVGVVFIARPTSLLFPSSPDVVVEDGIPNNSTILETAPTPELSSPIEPTTSQHLFAIALGLMGVFGAAIAITTIRYIGKRAHPLVSINYFGTWCTFVSLFSFAVIPGVSFRLPVNIAEWLLLLGVGVSGFVMQVLLTSGLAYATNNGPSKDTSNTSAGTRVEAGEAQRTNGEQPIGTSPSNMDSNPAGSSGGSKATSMIYTQMLFALLFDKMIWGVSPNVWSWLGSGLILGSLIWVSVARDKESTPAASRSAGSRSTNGLGPGDEDGLEMQGVISKTASSNANTRQEQTLGGEELHGLMSSGHDDDDDDDDRSDHILTGMETTSTLGHGHGQSSSSTVSSSFSSGSSSATLR